MATSTQPSGSAASASESAPHRSPSVASVWWVVGAVAVALVVLWAASPGAVTLWRNSEQTTEPVPPVAGELAPVEFEPVPIDDLEIADPVDLSWLGVVFGVLVALVLLAVAVAMIRWLIGLRFHRRPTRRGDPAGAEAGLPEIADAVREAEEDLYAALRTGSPRNAIVECWVRLEAAVAAAGAVPMASETSIELTERVLGRFAIDQTSLRDLGSLYREARFSVHELTEEHRRQAIADLRALADSLKALDPPPAEVGA